MARNKTVWNPEIEQRFQALAKKGCTAEDISRILISMGAEGASVATVGRRLRARKQGKPALRVLPAPAKPAPEAPPPLVASPPQPPIAKSEPKSEPAEAEHDGFDPMSQLQRSVEALEEIAREIRADGEEGNMKDYASIIRVQNQTIALVERLRPTPRADPNTAPDLIAAAESSRGKIFKRATYLVDVIRENERLRAENERLRAAVGEQGGQP